MLLISLSCALALKSFNFVTVEVEKYPEISNN